MYLKHRLFLVLSGILLVVLNSRAQQTDYSRNNPYSSYGIGELKPLNSLRNSGMAGTGVALSDIEYLNLINPAMLSRTRSVSHIVAAGETMISIAKTYSVTEDEIRTLNRFTGEVREGMVLRIPTRKYTKFEAAGNGGIRFVQSGTGNYTDRSLAYQHFVLLFPVSQRLTSVAGLAPYSEANFNSYYEYSLPDSTTVRENNTARGGLNQLFLSLGYDVTRHLSLGVQSGFIFGSLKSENFSQLKTVIDSDYANRSGQVQEVYYKAFAFKPSVFYTIPIKTPRDSSMFFNVGATYSFVTGASGDGRTGFENRNMYGIVLSDSTVESGGVTAPFPSELAIGVALQKGRLWSVGADFAYSTWMGTSTAPAQGFDYISSYRLSVGAETKLLGEYRSLTPKTPAIRIGAAVQRLPFLIQNSYVNDYSVSIGASIPVGRLNPADKNQPLNKVSLALTGGSQGSKSLGPGQEFYVRLSAGILITDKWFTRRKIQ